MALEGGGDERADRDEAAGQDMVVGKLPSDVCCPLTCLCKRSDCHVRQHHLAARQAYLLYLVKKRVLYIWNNGATLASLDQLLST